jgi:transposase
MEDFLDGVECYESLLRQGADRLRGHERRLFMAEVTLKLCDGNVRKAERRFGWGRDTVAKGLNELQQGVRCLENFAARGRPRMEDKNPQLAQDIRTLMEPHTQADPELKSARRYSSLSAAEVLEALQTKKGYTLENLPSERTMRDILNRMNYRLKRIQKGKPLKKTAQTNPIFANVKAVKEEAKGPETLEISVDTKAKVNEGDYARGGKNPDRRGRQSSAGLGS